MNDEFKHKVVVVHENDDKIFMEKCEDLINRGYRVSSTSSSTLGEEYNYALCLVAIMVKSEYA